jgi:simple sugar transport system permease protein
VTPVPTTALPAPAEGRPSGGRPAGERGARARLLRRTLARPELGAAAAALAILVFFLAVAPSLRTAAGIANVLDASSLLGIMAIAVALLMIGGEFDLSAGVQTASAALLATIVSYQLTLDVWAGVAISLAVTVVVGLLNGVLLARTGLPSFIVTLGTFFVLQGLNLAVTKQVTGGVLATGVATLDGWDSVRAVFASEVPFFGASLKISVVWWLGLTVLGSVLLTRTRTGNWIFAVGGEANAARQLGVPVTAVKAGLFAGVSLCAWLVGMTTMARSGSVQANLGIGLEFEYIIAAVIGGCLMTGGFGSVIGAALGALIFGMTKQGIPAAQWDNDWYKLFLGVMLLAATVLNTAVRRRASGIRS